MQRVGVILCGCGRYDGSEIHESTLALLHLARAGAQVQCAAPEGPQWAVCDSFTGQPIAGASRSMRVEAARIARGAVAPLEQLRAGDLDAVILPGGSGAARNLGDFAVRGAHGQVRPELAQLLRALHAAGKPIGAICIAPALVALALAAHRPRLTLGTLDGPAQQAAAAGAEMLPCAVDDIVVDERNRIVSTPAYILARSIREVDAGIGKLVRRVLEMA
ncbi:MAG: isoprenoid biosynthesis glyoxalase ElbB [Planctomycetota bacterium]|nr:MAG: isoprenoid biosynthesis glyoxalase ElbB [Planctomycetota bacterium]